MKTKKIFVDFAKIVLFCLVLYATTDYAFPKELIESKKHIYFRKLRYLTNISMYLALVSTIFGWVVKNDYLVHLYRKYVFLLAFSLSLTSLSTIMFWILNYIDPTLVRDKKLYDLGIRVSHLTEFSEHMFPLILTFLDQTDVVLIYDKTGVIAYILFGSFYYTFNYIAAKINGVWVYPILEAMTTIKRSLFIFSVSIFGMFLYYAFVFFNIKIINRK